MRMDEFVFHRPGSLVEASVLSKELGEQALFIAGGTDLITDLKRGRRQARHVISLGALAELRGIRREGDVLCIGALATHAQVAASSELRAFFPGLAEAAGMLGAAQIRNQGTIGGNFCAAVPCADCPPMALAGELRVRLVDDAAERELAAEAFFLGPRQSALRPGEILRELRVAQQPPASGASYQRFTLRGGLALSVASVAACLHLDGERIASARVVLGAVAPLPLLVKEISRRLEGAVASEELFAAAAADAAAAALPISDIRGSEAYRREIVAVMARRALDIALARARGEQGYPWEQVR